MYQDDPLYAAMELEIINAFAHDDLVDNEADLDYYGVPLDAMWKQGLSLRAGIELMTAAVDDDDDEAKAALESWRFNLPVRIVSKEEFEQMVARNEGVLFHNG